MPPAARVGDMHACPFPTTPPPAPPVPHGTGPIAGPGVLTVLIGNLPAAVMGDVATCPGPPNAIIRGSATVMIGGRPAARVGDQTTHGGVIAPPGMLTVMIGG